MALKDKFESNGSSLNPLKGAKPTTSLSDGATIPVNDTFSKGQYRDYVLDTDKASDITGN